MNISKYIYLGVSLTLLGACGGGGGSDGGGGGAVSQQGQVSVGITDAAVDGAQSVWVEFESIELKPQNGESIEFEYSPPRQIDLLTLQGNVSELLLENEMVPAGQYNWIRLHVESGECEVMTPGDSPEGSYIVLADGGIEPLYIPSGEESGLKLVSGFTVSGEGVSDYTIDFDLRKSIVKPLGQPCHYLKPTLRLVENSEAGSISGTVSAELINHPECHDDEEGEDDEYGNAVYVLSGLDVHPDDIDDDDLDDADEDEADDDSDHESDEDESDDDNGNEADDDDGEESTSGESSDHGDHKRGKVLTTALVELNEATGEYVYTAGFVPAGEYTVAFTCEAELDEPEDEDDLDFLQAANVSVVSGQNTVFNFDVTP